MPSISHLLLRPYRPNCGGVTVPPSIRFWCGSMPIEPPQVRMPMMGARCLILIASANISPLEPVSSLIKTAQGP